MSSEPVDDGSAARRRARTNPARRRRPLRVPIAEVRSISVLDDLKREPAADPFAATAEHDQPMSPNSDPPSGVTSAVAAESDPVLSAPNAEPFDSTLSTEPAIDLDDPDSVPPTEGEAESAAVSDAVPKAPLAAVPDSEPVNEAGPVSGRPTAPDPTAEQEEERPSLPPEELSLDEGDVSFIPMPKPPPPPVGYVPPPTVEQEPVLTSWFEDFFGQDYLATVRTPTPREVAAECDFIERALGLAPGARILDVGCGLGLQSVELAARGYQVIGLDISEVMISRASAEAEDRGLQIRFVHGDMRDIPFERCFDGVLCWGTTFGYFDEDDNEQAIREFNKVLRPKGVLLLDVVNRDFMIGSQPNQVWFEVDGSVCMEETDFHYGTSRLRVKRRVAAQGSGGERDREYSIRLYALHEVSRLMKRNGFRVDQVSGREATLGVFFGAHSPKMIVRAERSGTPTEDASPPPPVPEAVRRSSFRALPAQDGRDPQDAPDSKDEQDSKPTKRSQNSVPTKQQQAVPDTDDDESSE